MGTRFRVVQEGPDQAASQAQVPETQSPESAQSKAEEHAEAP